MAGQHMVDPFMQPSHWRPMRLKQALHEAGVPPLTGSRGWIRRRRRWKRMYLRLYLRLYLQLYLRLYLQRPIGGTADTAAVGRRGRWEAERNGRIGLFK